MLKELLPIYSQIHLHVLLLLICALTQISPLFALLTLKDVFFCTEEEQEMSFVHMANCLIIANCLIVTIAHLGSF